MPKLLKSNVYGLQGTVATQLLPAVFRDAITVARILAIPCVWIDALCILQDDPEDIRSEISHMGDIYRNACLDVGRLRAAQQIKETSVGLFADRKGHGSAPFPLTIQRDGLHVDCLTYHSGESDKIHNYTLMQRGWVLQERFLSRRSLYFDYQLYWECGERIVSEAFPVRMPKQEQFDWIAPGRTTPIRILTLLRTDLDIQQHYVRPLCRR
jgi:hypothetical protein